MLKAIGLIAVGFLFAILQIPLVGIVLVVFGQIWLFVTASDSTTVTERTVQVSNESTVQHYSQEQFVRLEDEFGHNIIFYTRDQVLRIERGW